MGAERSRQAPPLAPCKPCHAVFIRGLCVYARGVHQGLPNSTCPVPCPPQALGVHDNYYGGIHSTYGMRMQ